ncbi:MAG: inositol monophosphatase [Lachnospiraceae bacterium]|nr:inositol monophosphatase [Lachnospiraceae bacterium]
MKIDVEKVIEVVKTIKPLFNNHEKAGHIKAKGEQDFVTEVDTAVQRLINEKLSALYPDIQMFGEEKDNSEVDFSGDVWILDPVDGTTNLIHDFRFSALSLGYSEGGDLCFGVVYQPYTDELFCAEKGKGAFLNGKPIHVSHAETIHDSLISFGTNPYLRGDLSDKDFDSINRIFKECVDVRRLGSAALDLCYVAAGRSEGFFERRLKPWDFAAGTVIVREAGGEVVNYDGEPIDFTAASSVVGTNGRITGELLSYLL